MLPRITDVVRHLLIINILMFIGTMMMDDIFPSWSRLQLAMFFPTSPFFQPFQIVTHMFMHADFFHILMNMIGLIFFGPKLEVLWGPRKLLFFYLFCGFGALILHLLIKWIELEVGAVSPDYVNAPMLGASGAIFGVVGAYGLLFPNEEIMLLIPPIPIKAGLMVLLYIGFVVFANTGNFAQGIAHFAHLGGAVFGGLLLVYWQKYGSNL